MGIQTTAMVGDGTHLAVGQSQWYHFRVGAPPILEPILVVGLVDVHWGYDFDFDPLPFLTMAKRFI